MWLGEIEREKSVIGRPTRTPRVREQEREVTCANSLSVDALQADEQTGCEGVWRQKQDAASNPHETRWSKSGFEGFDGNSIQAIDMIVVVMEF